jgi:hypothetical protein
MMTTEDKMNAHTTTTATTNSCPATRTDEQLATMRVGVIAAIRASEEEESKSVLTKTLNRIEEEIVRRELGPLSDLVRHDLVEWPVREIPMSVSPHAAMALLREFSVDDVERSPEHDRSFVMRYLSHAGQFYGLLKVDEMRAVRMLADGFGTLVELPADSPVAVDDLVWDWSHVRDSSDEAFARMAEAICSWVFRYMR